MSKQLLYNHEFFYQTLVVIRKGGMNREYAIFYLKPRRGGPMSDKTGAVNTAQLSNENR